MDNQNTYVLTWNVCPNNVLILVLMDNQNTEIMAEIQKEEEVLILVLMDNQNTKCQTSSLDIQTCLNPCSNG